VNIYALVVLGAVMVAVFVDYYLLVAVAEERGV
jgi:hypothetical protein